MLSLKIELYISKSESLFIINLFIRDDALKHQSSLALNEDALLTHEGFSEYYLIDAHAFHGKLLNVNAHQLDVIHAATLQLNVTHYDVHQLNFTYLLQEFHDEFPIDGHHALLDEFHD